MIGVVEGFRDTLRSSARKTESAEDSGSLRLAARVCTDLLRAINAEDAGEAYDELSLLKRLRSDVLPWLVEVSRGLRDVERALRKTMRQPRIPREFWDFKKKPPKKTPKKTAKKTAEKKTAKKTKRKKK